MWSVFGSDGATLAVRKFYCWCCSPCPCVSPPPVIGAGACGGHQAGAQDDALGSPNSKSMTIQSLTGTLHASLILTCTSISSVVFPAGATHLVAIELALKIVQKINAGQRFMAYVMLPLFPEGATEKPLDSCDSPSTGCSRDSLQYGAASGRTAALGAPHLCRCCG